jgi:hypothetical protein
MYPVPEDMCKNLLLLLGLWERISARPMQEGPAKASNSDLTEPCQSDGQTSGDGSTARLPDRQTSGAAEAERLSELQRKMGRLQERLANREAAARKYKARDACRRDLRARVAPNPARRWQGWAGRAQQGVLRVTWKHGALRVLSIGNWLFENKGTE